MGLEKFAVKNKPEDEVEMGILSQKMRISRSMLRKILISRTIGAFGAIVVGLLIIYVGLAATLVRYIPSNSGTYLVQNASIEGSALSPRIEVLANLSKEVSTSAGTMVKYGFFPQSNTSVVKILGGPNGSLTWRKPFLYVNGKDVSDRAFEDPDNSYLVDEYVGECIRGDCGRPGSVVFLNLGNVYGIIVHPIEVK